MGNGHCAFQLAMAYKCGVVPANPSLEKKWLQVAAQLGYAEAEVALRSSGGPSISPQSANTRLRHLDKEKHIEEYLTTDETNKCSNPGGDQQEGENECFDVCRTCRHTKYCSKKCQKAHFHAGHKTECKLLEKSKEKLKEMNKNILQPLLDRCSFPQCGRKGETCNLRTCTRCSNAKYCSKECQRKHWKVGHKDKCDKTAAEMEKANQLLANTRL